MDKKVGEKKPEYRHEILIVNFVTKIENTFSVSEFDELMKDILLAKDRDFITDDEYKSLMDKAYERLRVLRGGNVEEPAGRYPAGDDRTKIKYLEDILVRTFIITQGRNPTTEEMQVIKQRIESLIRKYGTYTYKGLENAIYASLSIEDLGNMVLAIHASNLSFDDKKKLVEKIGERRRIFKGGLVEDAGESRPGNGFKVLTTLPGGVMNWEKTQKLIERLKRMGITVDVETQYFVSYQPRYLGDAPEFIVRSILKVPQGQVDKANYFMTEFMKSAGFEGMVREAREPSDKDLMKRAVKKISELPIEERRKIAYQIEVFSGKRFEPGKIITLDDIASLPIKERLKTIKTLLGPAEVKKAEESIYSTWTFDDFKTLISRITNLEDLLELEKHISESKVTTPRERIKLTQLVAQRETEIRTGGPELRKQIEEQQMMGRLAAVSRLREDEVLEDTDEPVEPSDYTQWTFSDFETFIPSLDAIDELEEMYEYVGASDKVSEAEGDMLRDMITKRLEKLRGA